MDLPELIRVRRTLPVALALLLVIALAAPGAAPAAWFPGDAIDGPSPDIVALDDLDIARDGTGAVVWRRLAGGVPHVYVSRLRDGVWRAPERVDGPVPDAAQEAAVAVAEGGRVAVLWVSWARVYGASAEAGEGLQPWSAPVLLHESRDAVPSGGLDADMGVNGTAFGVWRASGGGTADVRAARLKAATWTPVPAPLDFSTASAAGTGTGRPRVAVDAAGTPLVAWGESGRVYARRVIGLSPSQFPQEVSVPQFGGAADLPELDVEEDGAWAWVAFRQFDAGGAPRALARRLRGLQFDPPAPLDAGPGAGPPVLSINGRGGGGALAPAGGALLAADVAGATVLAPARLDSAGGVGEVAIAAADRRETAVAWRRDGGDGAGAVIGRFRPPGRPWEPEVLLARPELGPVEAGSLRMGGASTGDTAVAMLQGGPGARRIVVAGYDLPPGRAFPRRGWVRQAQPTLRWTGGNDVWGLQGYQVLIDGVVAGGTTGAKALRAPAPLSDGEHSLQVITVDRRGQAVPSGVRKVLVDTAVPTATLIVAPRARAAAAIAVRVDAVDVGSGVASVRVDYGDGTPPGREAATEHAWARPGRYRVTARVRDVAGNVFAATAAVRVRRAPRRRGMRADPPARPARR